MVPAREWEARVMSCRHAHRVPARRLVVVSRDPLAPDTDLHHRTIRECWVDYRTDGASGRDEKDVGVRSCSCGVAEKKSATSNGSRGPRGKLTRNPEPYSVWNGAPDRAALVQEWYYCLPEMSSNNVNGTLMVCESPAQLARRRHPAVAYIRTKPKQGAVSFAAIELVALQGAFQELQTRCSMPHCDKNLHD
jgi:hypothetical protein